MRDNNFLKFLARVSISFSVKSHNVFQELDCRSYEKLGMLALVSKESSSVFPEDSWKPTTNRAAIATYLFAANAHQTLCKKGSRLRNPEGKP